jgi:hypothetical protein
LPPQTCPRENGKRGRKERKKEKGKIILNKADTEDLEKKCEKFGKGA